MAGLEFVRVYIDDILCITNAQNNVAETEANVWERHLAQLEKSYKGYKKLDLRLMPRNNFLVNMN